MLIPEEGGATVVLQRRKRVRDVIPEAQEGLEGASSPRGKRGRQAALGKGKWETSAEGLGGFLLWPARPKAQGPSDAP